MSSILIKNGQLVNRGEIYEGDLLIIDQRIEKIARGIDVKADIEIDATEKYVLPGIIDDQVHFREPGLTYKADIGSESRAGVAGGVTSFMEMPNTKPSCLTQELLQDKYDIAAESAWANYSFFMGASNDNVEEVLKTDRSKVCGLKIFMGSSTGNMLVDDYTVLENLFSKVDMLIATHCEDEATIRKNLETYKAKYGEDITPLMHPQIRNTEGCYLSSSMAVELAKANNTRLHILHISTEKELDLFRNDIPLEEKRITAEACVHHLFFEDSQYEVLGNKIKCNPAIKSAKDREAIFAAMLDGRLDIIATDHAPHTKEEKANPYLSAPSGLPLVQHSLDIMMWYHQQDRISVPQIVDKMCHAPTKCFQLSERGYLDEGKFADVVLYDPNKAWTIESDNIYYKCGWSPLEGFELNGRVEKTIINGKLIYDNGKFLQQGQGMRLSFDRG